MTGGTAGGIRGVRGANLDRNSRQDDRRVVSSDGAVSSLSPVGARAIVADRPLRVPWATRICDWSAVGNRTVAVRTSYA